MSSKHLAAALLVTAGLAFAQGAAAQSPVAVAPEVAGFKLGAFTVTALRDAAIDVPNNGKVFALNATPEAVAQVLTQAGAPSDPIRLAIDGLLVKTPDHLALFDTGLGPMAKGVLIQSLALAGATPDQVTDVLITHGHFDHVGGLLDAAGHSAFPKATIRMAAAEWALAEGPGVDMKAPGRGHRPAGSKTFAPDTTLFPGVKAVAIKGHTPGHVGYEISSQGHSLLDIGDTAHSSIISLARPDWVIQFDGDAPVATASRQALLKQASADHTLIFAPHFPFPGLGQIQTAGASYGWTADTAAATHD